MNFLFLLCVLFIIGGMIGKSLPINPTKAQKIIKIIYFRDSKEGIAKKEKLVTIYLTTATIIVTLKEKDLQDFFLLTLFAVFLISVIFYIMDLGSEGLFLSMYVSGSLISFSFSILVTELLFQSAPNIFKYFLIFAFSNLIGSSLTRPYIGEKAEDENAEEYVLY
jgi:hypothetical protein